MISIMKHVSHGNMHVHEVIELIKDEKNKQKNLFLFSYLGAVGTPTFLINGVAVSADASWSVDDWKSVVDPLLATNEQIDAPTNTTCKPDQKPCEFLPGKIQCCLPGENCIQNVGCRCFNLRNGNKC